MNILRRQGAYPGPDEFIEFVVVEIGWSLADREDDGVVRAEVVGSAAFVSFRPPSLPTLESVVWAASGLGVPLAGGSAIGPFEHVVDLGVSGSNGAAGVGAVPGEKQGCFPCGAGEQPSAGAQFGHYVAGVDDHSADVAGEQRPQDDGGVDWSAGGEAADSLGIRLGVFCESSGEVDQ